MSALQDEKQPIVLVFYWGALMDAANGSQVRTLAQLSYLTTQFEKIVLYHFSNHPRDRWTEAHVQEFRKRFPNVELISDEEGAPLKVFNKLKKILVMAMPGIAKRVLAVRIPSLTPNYSKLHHEHPSIRYVVNYVDSLAQLNGVDCDATFVETHDLRYFRRGFTSNMSLVSFKNLLALRYEVSALSAVKGLISITENETYFFRNTVQDGKVFYVPEYQSDNVVEYHEGTQTNFDLLFAASGNEVNVTGFCNLLLDPMKDLTEFRIAVCGRICDRKEIQQIAATHPNITLLGFLSDADLEETYLKSKACLSPTDGTGLNIKLVEALRHSKPVFATLSSMKGLGAGYEACVFPIDTAVMHQVLSDPRKLVDASTSAANYYRIFASMGDLDAFRQALAKA